MPAPDVVVDLTAVRRRLVAVVTVLVALHVVVAIPLLTTGQPGSVLRLGGLVSLDEEGGVGTLVAVGLLAACAGVCWFAAVHGVAPTAGGWRWLAALFAFLALDEGIALHEGVNDLMDQLGLGGDMPFVWVIPYGVVVLVVLIASLPFLRRLSRPVLARLLLGGGVFVAGALGVELLGGWALDTYGFTSRPFLAFAGLEEALELSGASLALLGLLRHLATLGEMRLRVTAPG